MIYYFILQSLLFSTLFLKKMHSSGHVGALKLKSLGVELVSSYFNKVLIGFPFKTCGMIIG